MRQNLHELPNFSDRLSYLYVEHAVVEKHEKSIAIHQADGTSPVPAASLAVLMLGPGTSISQAAIQALADNNCLVIWCGEQGVRFYAAGLGGARHSRNLLHQARLAVNDLSRLQVVIRMYCRRFNETIDSGLSIQQLRGKEGIRVRQAYAEASKATGVPWQGRSYDRGQWNFADPVNRSLSAANSCLYGLCHAAMLSVGYSPAIGFIHTGKQLSFVYDIADLYKADLTIPLAFQIVADGATDVERRTRWACRDLFHQSGLIARILPDIRHVLDVQEAETTDEFAGDEALPAELWSPQGLAEMPIGRILKLDSIAGCGETDGRNDSGTGAAVSTG